MTADQLKSNALLAISALVAGTAISLTAHFLLTEKDTGSESPNADAVEVTSLDPTDSTGSTDSTAEIVPGNKASGKSGDSSESDVADAMAQPKPEEVAYSEKMEVLFAKLDALKLQRQAIRDRIQFESLEF